MRFNILPKDAVTRRPEPLQECGTKYLLITYLSHHIIVIWHQVVEFTVEASWLKAGSVDAVKPEQTIQQ